MCSMTIITTLTREEARMAGLKIEAKLGRKFTPDEWRFWEPFLRLFGPVEVLSVEEIEAPSVEDAVLELGGQQLLLGRSEVWR